MKMVFSSDCSPFVKNGKILRLKIEMLGTFMFNMSSLATYNYNRGSPNA